MNYTEEKILEEQYFKVTNMDRAKAKIIRDKYLLMKAIRNPRRGLHYEFVEGYMTFNLENSTDSIKYYMFRGTLSEKNGKGPNIFFKSVIREEKSGKLLISNNFQEKTSSNNLEYQDTNFKVLLKFEGSKFQEIRIIDVGNLTFEIKEKQRTR